MCNSEDLFGDNCSEYSRFKDVIMELIIVQKKNFEQNLDDMWSIYQKGVPQQIINYQKDINQIKKTGLKVLRNSQGKHKIIVPK